MRIPQMAKKIIIGLDLGRTFVVARFHCPPCEGVSKREQNIFVRIICVECCPLVASVCTDGGGTAADPVRIFGNGKVRFL